jgi:uncharacterized protein
MAGADFLGKGWRNPIGLADGAVAYVESEESIRESILIILGTARGERVMRPEFGCALNELVFAPNSTTTAALAKFYVKEALTKWEPRIHLLEVDAAPDPDEAGCLNIEISYQVKTTNSKDNLVYPFYLEGKK